MATSFYEALFIVGLCAPFYCVLPATVPRGECLHPSSTKNNAASQVSSHNTDFAFRLYRRLISEAPSQNVFFSPMSVSTSLAMLSLGARSATKTQILLSLGFNLTHTPEPTIHQAFRHLVHLFTVPSKALGVQMGNVLFIKKELQLQANFLDNVKRLYEVEVFPTDFSNPSKAQARINSYVKKETKGKVENLVQNLDPLTAMVLVNHIFFKAKWEKPFNPVDTKNSFPFLLGKGTTVPVPMMHQMEQFSFGVDPELDCFVLQMDYRGDNVAFFVLPGKGKMRQLEQALSAQTLRKWRHSLQKRWIEVFIPKFSISASYNLETILPKMGIRNAFDKNADFSGIVKRDSLQVSKATHKAVLDVGEEGTEAVAATATKLVVRSKDGPSHNTVFFDRPFLLLLMNQDIDSVLFVGKVEKPTRMALVWPWLLTAGILAAIQCQPLSDNEDQSLGGLQPPSHQLSEPAPAYHKITPTIINFALRLYKQLAADISGNIFFSPVSISTTLALLSFGAQPDISTQILEGLGFNLTETPEEDIHRSFQSLIHTLDLPSPKLELKVGNSLFLDKHLKPQKQFSDSIKEVYGAFVFSANFTDSVTIRRQINDYVRKQTYGQIVDCLQEFNQDTLMVLSNYIFFKAKWKHPFNRYQTQKQESFSVDGRTSLQVPMMHQKEMHRFHYDQEMACTVLQIEYSGNALALIILPDPGKMRKVEVTLQPETLRKWGQLFMPSLLDLHLPRISIAGTYNLEEILPRIGLTNVFNIEASLSGLGRKLNTTISRVLHKAAMTMSEKGTEATTASGLLSQPPSMNMTSATSAHFNRPFLLLLWEVTTQSLLFLGKVVNPAAM
ncbi:serpin A11 [Nycticebus coucang]|uniref:serpin A11 n=1 Tax=Nycticebus coucang TaxID=9470 RepID=UPI00234D74DD|nr:serpin A11 [Nycticebus coucang]